MPRRRVGADGQLGLDGVDIELPAGSSPPRKAAELRQVDPRKLARSAAQPRQHFDPARLTELAESFRAVGVLQPLLARERSDGTLELLAGERRQKAAILAGLSRVPVRVLTVSQDTAAVIAMTENLARDDLSAWEEALGLARLRDAFRESGEARTRDELARMVGRSNGSVSESLQIADRLGPLLPLEGIDGQTLTDLPKTALNTASRGRTAAERERLLRLAVVSSNRSEAAGKAVAAARNRKGRRPKAWTVSDRLKDRGTMSFNLRKRPEELAPEEARDALDRLMPVVEALRARMSAAPRSS
jgi:ParB/RepB/Spo0J family partition protein